MWYALEDIRKRFLIGVEGRYDLLEYALVDFWYFFCLVVVSSVFGIYSLEAK